MINLINDYVIDVSDYGYTVKIDLHKQSKQGKQEIDLYTVIGYYSSLTNAIKAACESMNKKELSEGIYTLTNAIDVIKRNTEVFSKLLSDNIPEVKVEN